MRSLVRWLTATSSALLAGWSLVAGYLPGATHWPVSFRVAAVVAGAGLAASCLMPLEWNRRVLLVFASCAIGLILGEGLLRVFFAPRYTTIYRIDEKYLHTLIPERAKIFTHLEINGGHSVLVRTNSEGFRGEELLGQGAARRILIYGDSIIEAEFSALENTFVERLETELATRLETPVEGVNAGVVGYGPDQISLRLEDEIGRLNPDLIIVAFFADNDLGDLLRNKIYRLDADGSLRANDYLISLALREEFERAQKLPMLYRLLTKALWSADAWRIDPLAHIEESQRETARMEVWLDACRRDYEDYILSREVVTNLMMDYYDADVSLTPGSRGAELKTALMEQVLRKMRHTTDTEGIPMLLLIIPAARDACDSYDYGKPDSQKHPDYRPSTLTALVEKMAERQGIRSVNLFMPFRQGDACGLYFRGGEDHWNDAGQALAGRHVADYIMANDLLRVQPPENRSTSSCTYQ